MKNKLFFMIGIAAMLLTACASEPTADPLTLVDRTTAATQSSAAPQGEYTESGDSIIAPDGTEYVLFATEWDVSYIGETTFSGHVVGEDTILDHLGGHIPMGLYTLDADPDRRVLKRILPDSEWAIYYRRADLPPMDLSVYNCVKFEMVDTRKGSDEAHLTCEGGIVGRASCHAFLQAVIEQPSANRETLYALAEKPNGISENCYYLPSVYGFFEEEPTVVLPLRVCSYNDLAYSLEYGDEVYVLSEEWLEQLQCINE